MSRFIPRLAALKDKVVVVTGGSSGIGAAVVELLCKEGAKVVFGDIQFGEGQNLVARLASPNVKFVQTDVTKYGDLIALFETALALFGHIDCAISNAAVPEVGNFINPDLNLQSIKEVPSTRTLDVNLLGTLYFARIAVVFLRQNLVAGTDKSLILLSSVSGFKETPGMPVYESTKHGVLGLLRCLRMTLPTSNIRVNAICPWFVDTIMTAGIKEKWKEHELPINDPAGVAAVILGVACEKGMNGKSIYVEGNRGWEIEDNIDRLEPEWLGVEQSKELNRGQDLMGSGVFWQV